MAVSEKTELTRDCNGGTGDPEDPEDSEVEEKRPILKKETFMKLKSIAGHVGLLVTLMLYTAIGGVVFHELEQPGEVDNLKILSSTVLTERELFINTIANKSNLSNMPKLMCKELENYEKKVQDAAQAGRLAKLPFDCDQKKYHGEFPDITTEQWSVLQAVFFASTVLTTIGYGNAYPTTVWGRIFCILFALVGIPLTLTVIADWGRLFAGFVSEVGHRVRTKLPNAASNCMPNNLAGRRSLGALAAVVFLFLYLACGAAMFVSWEEDWNFFDGFYFCFVTMTTIGFGDLVPKKQNYMLLCTLYILVGLALTSTIIELVRRQYAQSWRQLQALSGPLAETLKRLGEHAGGDMSALHTDLRKVLAVVSMPRLKRGGGGVKDHEWREAVEVVIQKIQEATPLPPAKKQPIMQIVIYESSV